VDPWQHAGWQIWEGGVIPDTLVENLAIFVDGRQNGYLVFRTKVADPIDHIIELIHRQLFGKPTNAERVLTKARREHEKQAEQEAGRPRAAEDPTGEH
jgi:hypothetical protein